MCFQTDQTKCRVFFSFIFVLRSLINLHVLLGKINCISLMQYKLFDNGMGTEGELDRAENEAMYSARLFCQQVMFFFKTTLLLIKPSITLLLLQPILHTAFPLLSATCQVIVDSHNPNLQVIFLLISAMEAGG